MDLTVSMRPDFGLAQRDAEAQPMVGFPTGGTSGVLPYNISASTVMGLSTVWRCLDVIANGVSQLPWTEHRGTLDLPLSRISRRPSAFYTRREWVQLVVRTLALFDIAYLLKLEPLDAEGVPMGLWPVPPQIIIPRSVDVYTLVPPTTYVVGRTTVDADQLVVIRRAPLPGIPEYLAGLLNMARAQFAESLAASNYASRFWQGGASPVTVLETEANLGDTQATQLGNRWTQRRAQGPDHPAVLSSGLKARPYGADLAAQSATEARQVQEAQIARYFGVPARLANVISEDSQTYKTSQEENIDLLHYTLQNYIGGIEDAITDLLPGQREMTMVTSQLTEGTQLARYQAYQLATGNAAWMAPSEAREAENMPPMEMTMPDDDSQRPMMMPDRGPSDAMIAATTGRPAG